MDVIQSSNKHVDMFGPGLHGFEGGSPSGTPATFVTPEWCNMIQQELVNIVLRAGGTLNPASRTQVADAVQALIAGATGDDHKGSVRVATTANIASLNGGAPNTLDGVALAANNRILVKDQTTPSQNGIYYVATLGTGANGIWLRAVDADGAGELSPGTLVAVEEGTAQADTLWLLSTDGPITIGTTGIGFVRRDSGAANTAQLASGSASVAANALTVTLDPSTTDFRSTTLTSGARTSVSNSSALSLTVPNGATLGTTNGIAARLAVLEINNAGVKELAIVNLAGGNNLDETTLISTTAIDAASDSANVIYSATARASVPFRVRMLVDISQAAAGVWASAPTLVQPVGGQAGAAMQSIGYGQTWQDVTGSRAAGTTYYNLTGKPIQLAITYTQAGTGTTTLTIGGQQIALVSQQNTSGGQCLFAIVPPGASYVVNLTANSVNAWRELR